MSRLKVIHIPNPILNKISRPIEIIDKKIKKLASDMLETMYYENGIGLAAPQIGKNIRLIVIDIGLEQEGINENTENAEEERFITNPMIFINPEIISYSKEKFNFEEGCLSVPKVKVEMTRYKEIEVKYLNEKGELKLMKAQKLLSVCIQHEIDHLNGITIADEILRQKIRDSKFPLRNIID